MKNPFTKDVKIVEKWKIWIAIPVAILLIGAIFGIIFKGFNLGIDFTGGTNLEIKLGEVDDSLRSDISDAVTAKLDELGIKDRDALQFTGAEDDVSVKVTFRNTENYDDATDYFTKLNASLGTSAEDYAENSLRADLLAIMQEADANYQSADMTILTSSIGARSSSSLVLMTFISLIVAVFLILIYISIRFELLAGLTAVIALVHDVLIVVAFMLISRMVVNASFIACLITIIGYSINNTIVIFDRVRENRKKLSLRDATPAFIANRSIMETMTRSINTTITTLVTIVVLACFPIADLRNFALPIIVGLVAGTYSSIFLAGSLWTLMMRNKKGSKAVSAQEKPALAEEK